MANDPPVLQPARRPFVNGLLIAIRLAFGYIVAVGAGAVIFAMVSKVFDPFGNPEAPPEDWWRWLNEIGSASMMFFVLGLAFGLPYTILGSLIFRFVLPRRAWSFMLIGALCPAAAIFLAGIGMGGTIWFNREFFQLALRTLPSGIVAAYLFGAIGFGFGFGRWRIG